MTQRLGALFCCIVAAAIGCVASASTAAADWLPPVAIAEPSERAGSPHVVLDSAGNATAVWDRWNGVDTVVETAFRPAGGSWEAPVDLSEPEPGDGDAPGAHDAQSPRIAVDAAGDVTVVWERYGGSKILVQAVERPAGGEWSAPVDLGETPLGPDPEPWVAVDADGDALAVWKLDDVVQAAYRSHGGGWESPVAVSAGEGFVPEAAMNSAGDATVVWMAHRGGRYVVESAFRPAGGGWEAPTLVSAPGEEGGDPQIALDAAGDTLVAWRGEDADVEYVRTAYRPVGGPWAAPTDASRAGEQVGAIRDAVDPDGNAIVAWSGDDPALGGYQTVRAAFRPADGTWGAPSDLSADGGNGFPSDVVFDESGNAALLWQRSGTAGNVIEASYRPAGGDWEPAVPLSEEGKAAMDAVVVLDAPGDASAADGDATAVWVSDENLGCGFPKLPDEPCFSDTVQAAGYDPDGLPALNLEAPTEAHVGEPIEVSMSTAGVFSPRIGFGDGAGAAGSTASHAYATTGQFELSGAGAEVLGYTAAVHRTITIVPEGTPIQPHPSEPGQHPGDDGGDGTGDQSVAGSSSGADDDGPTGGTVIAGTGVGSGPTQPGDDPTAGGPSAACTAARAKVRADRRRLSRAAAANKKARRSKLKAAMRRVAAAC